MAEKKTKKTASSSKKTVAKKEEPVKAVAKQEAAPEKVVKRPLRERNRVIEIPIFGKKIKAVYVMDRGDVSLFRGVDQKITLQIPKNIVPDNI